MIVPGYWCRLFKPEFFHPLNMVLNFECSDSVMTERIIERGKTSGRVDDNEEAIQKRLHTFYSQTKPVVEYYKHMGRLRKRF